MTIEISAALIGIGLAALILVLLQRDYLYLRDAIFWLAAFVEHPDAAHAVVRDI